MSLHTPHRRPLRFATAIAIAIGIVFVTHAAAAPVSNTGAKQTIPIVRIGLNWASIGILDTARSSGATVLWPANLGGLETLMTIAPNGKVRPHLARSVSRPNPLTYIYTLRRGIRFWNGAELTAVDAANAINYYRYRQLPSSADLGYPSVRSVTAEGRYTVVVRLKQRNPLWQYTPAVRAPIFEKKFADDHPGTMGRPGVLFMGTGPFRFDSFDPTRGIELSANPKYWGGRVPVQRISARFIPDATNLGLAFRAGEIDFVPVLFDTGAFEAASGTKAGVIRTCGEGFFAMNTKKPPWNDVHVRRAAAYAIDKAAYIRAIGNYGLPVSTILSPRALEVLAGSKAPVAKLTNSLPKYSFSLTKAREEMAKSRYPNGATTRIQVMASATQGGQALSAMLARVGITAEVTPLPQAAYNALVIGPRENIDSIHSGYQCTAPDPAFAADRIIHSKRAKPGALNTANYTNPAADALIDTARRLTDPAKRFEAYSKLLTILARDMPYVPLHTNDYSYAISSRFTYPQLNQSTYFNSGWGTGFRPR